MKIFLTLFLPADRARISFDASMGGDICDAPRVDIVSGIVHGGEARTDSSMIAVPVANPIYARRRSDSWVCRICGCVRRMRRETYRARHPIRK